MFPVAIFFLEKRDFIYKAVTYLSNYLLQDVLMPYNQQFFSGLQL